VRLQAEMRSENNFYDTVANPIFRFLGNTGQSILTFGNVYLNSFVEVGGTWGLTRFVVEI